VRTNGAEKADAALRAATVLVAEVVVRQRAIDIQPDKVVDELAAATTQHLAVLGELADVLQARLAQAAEQPQGAGPGASPARLRDTAAALKAALSSAELFSAELVTQLAGSPLPHSA
jgi:hypothetical protein